MASAALCKPRTGGVPPERRRPRDLDRYAFLLFRADETLHEVRRGEAARDRSRKDGRYPQCKACVRRWHQDNAGRLAEYNRRWRELNRDKQRAWDRRYRERKRARTSDAPPEANDG
jgi:hypothetical protein